MYSYPVILSKRRDRFESAPARRDKSQGGFGLTIHSASLRTGFLLTIYYFGVD